VRLLLAALAAVALAAVPASATAPVPLVVTDQGGDANALNDQAFLTTVPALSGTPTPVDANGFDIRRVTLVTDAAGSDATTLVATLEVTGPVQLGGVYRVTTNVGGVCLWLERTYSPAALYDTSAARVCDESPAGQTSYAVASVVSGSTVTWTVPLATYGSLALASGTVVSDIGADARLSEASLTVPSVDVMRSTEAYTVGQ